MGIITVVDEIAASQIFRAFWFTQYYAFCAVVVLYIYRIQQGELEPGKCEGYYKAGLRTQRILASISGEDSLSKRYCLVLEELRIEAVKVRGRGVEEGEGTQVGRGDVAVLGERENSGVVGVVGGTDGVGGDGREGREFGETYYVGEGVGEFPTPESGVFGGGFVQTSSVMADFTSWGQFDSLVTAGIGMLDGGGFPGDAGFGFGMGM